MKISKLLAVVAAVVLFLWFGGHPTYAVLAAIAGALVCYLNAAMYSTKPCGWCDHGRQWSPFGDGFKTCKHCGGSGFRKRLGAKDD